MKNYINNGTTDDSILGFMATYMEAAQEGRYLFDFHPGNRIYKDGKLSFIDMKEFDLTKEKPEFSSTIKLKPEIYLLQNLLGLSVYGLEFQSQSRQLVEEGIGRMGIDSEEFYLNKRIQLERCLEKAIEKNILSATALQDAAKFLTEKYQAAKTNEDKKSLSDNFKIEILSAQSREFVEKLANGTFKQ